jgi:hypothetical protein
MVPDVYSMRNISVLNGICIILSIILSAIT